MEILPRSAWNAAPPKQPGKPWAPGGPVDLVVHWVGGSGTLTVASHADCPYRIRQVQAGEMAGVYSDIAYSLVACVHGVVYEGRGLDVQGAANGPATNSTKPSVCLLLNQQDTMTPAMQRAVLELNRTVTPGKIYGHREVNSTACPGDDVYQWILAQRINPPSPPTPPAPIATEDTMLLLRGDATPHVYLVAGNTKLHLTGDQPGKPGTYGPWLLFCVANVPGSTDPTTKREWIVPQRMVDAIPPAST